MINNTVGRLILYGEDDCTLEIYYDTMGEPYRDGICIELRISESEDSSVFLRKDEVQKLINKLTEIIEKLH
jgi:hypothetical protein